MSKKRGQHDEQPKRVPANLSGADAAALQNLQAMHEDARAALCALTPEGRLWLRLAAAAAEMRLPAGHDPLLAGELDSMVGTIANRLDHLLGAKHRRGTLIFHEGKRFSGMWAVLGGIAELLPRVAPSMGNPLGGEDELDGVPVTPLLEQYVRQQDRQTRRQLFYVIYHGDLTASIMAAAGRQRAQTVDSVPQRSLSVVLPAEVLQAVASVTDDARIELLALVHAEWSERDPGHAPGGIQLHLIRDLQEVTQRRGAAAVLIRQFVEHAEIWQLPALADALAANREEDRAVHSFVAQAQAQKFPDYEALARGLVLSGGLCDYIQSRR